MLILFFTTCCILSHFPILDAIGNENKESNTEIHIYNPKDYDPGIPLEWIKPDGTFGE